MSDVATELQNDKIRSRSPEGKGANAGSSPSGQTGMLMPAEPTLGTSRKFVYVDYFTEGIPSKTGEDEQVAETKWPAPKTDKPRPHVCLTCRRSFARLEHLKRHERSHTKEKPFECPECTRCFARRDLLLRHQQKLHTSTTPASRPRSGRRESTSSTTASGRVRKSSVSHSATSTSMRPRANTISHIDSARLGFLAAANASAARKRPAPSHSQHPSLSGLPGPRGFDFRGMSTTMGHNRQPRGLPKLETHGLPLDLAGNLRTAPAFQGFPQDYGLENTFSPGNTINPAQLHFTDSPDPLGFDTPISPFPHTYGLMQSPIVDNEGAFDWIDGFDNSMTFGEPNDHAIAESSPSAISAGSPGGMPDIMAEVSNIHTQSTAPWQPSTLSQAPMLADYSMDMSGPILDDMKLDPLSPKQMDLVMEEGQFTLNPASSLQSSVPPVNPSATANFPLPFMSSADTPTTAASVGSSNRQSSVTSVCTDSITDATRSALLASLSQPSSVHFRKYSSPSGSSPPVTESPARSRSFSSVSLPSTYDLQRYVSAYVHYFHPHLPFLHIPTLSFNSPTYTNNLRSQDIHSTHGSGISGGGGCLILAMAAIGALYEFDNATSKELFDLAKKMIQLYLEDRRKADMAAAVNGRPNAGDGATQNTPLWLVQAMLLNVIYGHNCGDKTSADIASTHCAALVSLARAADLVKPSDPVRSREPFEHTENWNIQGHDGLSWYHWKEREEKKRTLYAVFHLSSLLVSAYNHSPALTNSEISLDLPCDEDLWAADSPEGWLALGGSAVAASRTVSFADALSWLLTACQRHPYQSHNPSHLTGHHLGSSVNGLLPMRADFPVSTFGCLVLINALHNYIWETRQRHLGRPWTAQETEAMHAHIEPALSAWQAAWAANPHHSLERPNPHGMGPLSADSIPLLDLAYVRLFVNLGRSKEAFWQRDFDAMSHEIARGAEIIQHADSLPSSSNGTDPTDNRDQLEEAGMPNLIGNGAHRGSDEAQDEQAIKRERHLRKAAFHAANSLLMSEKLGVSFADFNSRELPLQSAMCAFDCAQVLAEWVCTIQERVGRYIGVLGKDQIDFEAVPGIMLVDQEDINLFAKIDEFLASMELKMAVDSNTAGNAAGGFTVRNGASGLQNRPYGSKILMVTAYILERSAVWPGMQHAPLFVRDRLLTWFH